MTITELCNTGHAHQHRLKQNSFCPPTLVEGDCINGFVRPSTRPSVRPSVDTILSTHLLLQFLGISMKFSSYCSHDLKVFIFNRAYARLIFTRAMTLWQFLNGKSCLCNFSRSFQRILVKVTVQMTWRRSYFTEFTLDRFLPELWPFVSFSHFVNTSDVSATPFTFLKGFWWNLLVIVSMTWR